METIVRMSRQELKTELETLSRYFTCVRLLDRNNLPVRGAEAASCEEDRKCYEIWNKERHCDYCISARALSEKSTRTKLERVGDSVFQITAKYVEVDGEPCVLEMVREFDDDFIAELSSEGEALAELGSYYEKIYRDVLTGCYNRRYYEERLKNTVPHGGVALLDIDDFKLYNDVYGHAAGDMVLRAVVEEIKKCLSSEDKLIRYGGDEFLIFSPETEPGAFLDTLYNIRAHINDTKVEGFAGIGLSVSMGAAYADNESVWKATERADALLMYRAKRGKNSIVTDRDETVGKVKEKPSILIVDDSELNREILISILGNEFQTMEAGSGEECVSMLEKYGTRISVVLLDVVMPGMGGFEVLSYMNVHHLIEEIPVIMITGDESDQSVRKAYELGVSDYINRPFDVKVVYRRVMNTIQLYSKQRRLLKRVTEQMVEKENNSRMMVSILSQIVEFRNGESGRHVIMVQKLTAMVLRRLVMKTDRYQLTARDIDLIKNASALHDIGKIAIDEKILNKPGRLTPEEFEVMKTHTSVGADMLWSLKEYRNEPLVKYAWEICRYHHEKYNGKGYPDGLVGEEIPISAQVVSICDVYDALVSKRVYKEAFSHERAMQIILEEEKDSFNPLVAECFRELSEDLVKLYASYSEEGIKKE